MPKAMKNGKNVGWSLARGEYRMTGDFGSEKNMRNGKYAFPQLRNFHRLRDLKGETLFDNFMSVLSANHKHLCDHEPACTQPFCCSLEPEPIPAPEPHPDHRLAQSKTYA